MLALLASPSWAFDSGSTGADGALNPSSDIEIVLPPSGVLNYTSVNIPVGVTVRFRKNALNTPAVILASSNVVVAGTIDVRGGNAPYSGTQGGGNVADDGQPGLGGPGGYDGGSGGRPLIESDRARSNGGNGKGPGGGAGGLLGATNSNGNCINGRISYWLNLGYGAAYAQAGANPNSQYGCGTPVAQAYGAPALQPLIGGSGGGGGGGNTFAGAGGGGGGGAILIASSSTLTISGNVVADGGGGGTVANNAYSGGGAGGSGGAIRLVATSVVGNGSLFARGGCTRDGDCYPYVWAASVGRIRIEGETITFNGTSNPTASRDVPAPVTIANAPALRISAIGGVSVPETPTGVNDVRFDTAPTNPVRVDFTTNNIPPGNTVLLRVVPESGNVVQALSPAISGTTANGTASVSVNLPTGASTLQAIASFTVAVAMGEALSNYAYGERVERVEITATLGAPSMATLITVSGKRAQVPVELLRLYGALG